MTTDKQHITVIGLGAMGRALAGAFLDAGHPTTVFNRSADKADELVARGAQRAETIADALAASELTIVCVLDYAIARDLLERGSDALAGRTIVNLTNGSPADARELATWVAQRGAAYLDGGIMAVPPTIAQPGAFILLSGDAQVLERSRAAITVLGEPVDVGRDVGLAALYDIALLSGLMGMTAGAHHAVALVDSADGDVEAFKRTLLLRWMEAMLPFTAGTANAQGTIPDAFNPGMQAVSLENMLAASLAQRVDEAKVGHLHSSLALMRAAAAAPA